MGWKKVSHQTTDNTVQHYNEHYHELLNLLHKERGSSFLDPTEQDLSNQKMNIAHTILEHFNDLSNFVYVDFGKDENEIFDDLLPHYPKIMNWHNTLTHSKNPAHTHNDPEVASGITRAAEDVKSHLWDVDMQKLLEDQK